MQAIAVWLAALVPTLAARVLASLGFGLVAFAGCAEALTAIKNLITSNLQGAPSAITGLLSLAGVGDALGIIFGGFSCVMSYHLLTMGTRLAITPK